MENDDMEWVSYAFQGLTDLFITGPSAVAGFMIRKRPRWAAFVVGSQPFSMQPSKVFVRINNVGNGTEHNVRTIPTARASTNTTTSSKAKSPR